MCKFKVGEGFRHYKNTQGDEAFHELFSGHHPDSKVFHFPEYHSSTFKLSSNFRDGISLGVLILPPFLVCHAWEIHTIVVWVKKRLKFFREQLMKPLLLKNGSLTKTALALIVFVTVHESWWHYSSFVIYVWFQVEEIKYFCGKFSQISVNLHRSEIDFPT